MALMAHRYRFTFHRRPEPGADFRWSITEPVEVTAMTATTAENLARRVGDFGADWQVRECEDLGRWDRVQ